MALAFQDEEERRVQVVRIYLAGVVLGMGTELEKFTQRESK